VIICYEDSFCTGVLWLESGYNRGLVDVTCTVTKMLLLWWCVRLTVTDAPMKVVCTFNCDRGSCGGDVYL